MPGLAPTSPTSSSGLPPSLNLPADYAVRRQAEAEAKVREYLDKEKPRVEGQIIIGASVAELVDLMRRNVPEARELAPEQIAQFLRRYSPRSRLPSTASRGTRRVWSVCPATWCIRRSPWGGCSTTAPGPATAAGVCIR